MSTLLTSLDLREPLMRTAEVGASFVTDALAGPAREILRAEITAGSFEPLPDRIGPYGVRQEAELLQIDPDDDTAYPTVCQLRIDLARLVHADGQGIAGLAQWRPNDIAAMRYHAGSLGITPHRDNKRYRHLIAIFTIESSASFTLCGDREGTVVDHWQTLPSSLVLLRAPGLAGVEDGRPFHTVGGPTSSTRISLTLRNSQPTP
jgi:hypothetical protein